MGLSIRLARQEEYAAVGRLMVDIYCGEGFIPPEADYVAELADTGSRARDAELIVAADGDAVLGSVTYCRAGSPYAELAGDNEGEFRMLAVSPAARGRGVARALVETCLDRSRELTHSAIVLSTMPDMHAAHRLYEKLGFFRTPERDWSPVAGVDLMTFAIRLSGHPNSP